MIAHLCLGSRGIDGFRQLGRVHQACGQLHAAYGLVFLVFLPAAAGQIAAHHRFNHDGLEALDQHGAALHLLDFLGRHHGLGGFARQVVRADVAQLVKPKQRHLRQQYTLARNGFTHDHIESRQTVRRHHQNAVIAHGVVVTHLAASQQRQRGDVGSVQSRSRGLCHERAGKRRSERGKAISDKLTGGAPMQDFRAGLPRIKLTIATASMSMPNMNGCKRTVRPSAKTAYFALNLRWRL